jgi:hypothetical protein
MAALVVGGALVAGALGVVSCGDNEPAIITGGRGGAGFAGAGGRGGAGARGGAGGVTGVGGVGGTTIGNVSVFTMQMNGTQAVPVNNSTGTAMVKVTLDRSTGTVTVTGTFQGLIAAATEAHIHGPALAGAIAPPIMTLTVPAATAGDITGSFNMTGTQMDDMTNGMTYVDIHTSRFLDGEIRAQIVP